MNLPYNSYIKTGILTAKGTDIMSELTLQVIDADGFVSPKKLAYQFHTTIKDIATISGLSIDSVTKKNRSQALSSQKRLKEIVLILNRITPWCGSIHQAYAWFRSESLPSFGGLTAEELVKDGMADKVMHYLARTSQGGYA